MPTENAQNFEIVEIVTGNIPVLVNVAEDVFDHAIDPALLAAYLAQDGHMMVVALKAGVGVGQARAVVHAQPDCPPQLFVDNLGVTPKLKRMGIATALMEKLVELGKTRGCAELWLATETDNVEANGFYGAMELRKTNVVMFANFVDD